MLGSSLLWVAFSLVVSGGLLSSCGCWASHWSGFSRFRLSTGSKAHRLQELWHMGSGSWGSWAQLGHRLNNCGTHPSGTSSRPGTEPACRAGGFFTTVSPRKSLYFLLNNSSLNCHLQIKDTQFCKEPICNLYEQKITRKLKVSTEENESTA